MRLGLVVLVLATGCSDSFEGPCGNGALDPFEECDDGNIEAGDRCSPNCTREHVCGDLVVDSPRENCDDGNSVPGDNCDENCRVETVCGDLDIEPGEKCEDGNVEPSDGCSPECQVEYMVSTRISWRFATAGMPGEDLGCPAGFDTVEVTTQALRDDDTDIHAPKVERFSCADGFHDIRRFQGRYRVGLRVTDASGVPTYATSLARAVDMSHAVQSLSELFVTDGGLAQIAWELLDPITQQPVTCADAGVVTMGLLAVAPGFARSGFMLCAAGRMVTAPLQAGDYTLTLSAIDEDGDEIENTAIETAITITAPNGGVDVGTLSFPAP